MKTFISSTQSEIFIGENMSDNDKMFRLFDKKYIFFHLNDFSSAHAYIVHDNINSIPHELIEEVGKLIKHYSKVKNRERAMIFYTLKSNLKKTDKVGEVEIINPKLIYYYIVEKDENILKKLKNTK